MLIKLKSQGKSVFVVHHDLQTAADYFDWIVLLNQTIIASGPAVHTFTPENLQEAYGGKLFFMDQASSGKTAEEVKN